MKLKATAKYHSKSFYRLYKLYISGDLTVTDIARTMECSRTTVYKYIAAITK